MASLRRKLAGIGQRLRPRTTPYRPRLDRDEFPAPQDEVLTHFLDRFVLSTATVREKIQQVQQCAPAWREHSKEQVTHWLERGLPVYAITGSPLGAGFDWGGPQPQATQDDLYRLRPHRFAFAPQLALTCHYDPGLLQACDETLDHWISRVVDTEAPWAYRSSLVAIQRLLALSWALAFIAALAQSEEGAAVVIDKLLRIVHSDLHYLWGVAGNSVANNHLLADRFILWYGAHLFPQLFPGGENTREREQEWLAEFERQTYASGGGFEHSLHYHEFDTELGLLYFLLQSQAGNPVPDAFTGRLENALALQAQLGCAELPIMAFGNATEDPMLPLDASLRWPCGAWTEIYDWFVSDKAPDRPAPCRTQSSFWLLPFTIPDTTTDCPAAPGSSTPNEFPEAGIHCFTHPGSDTRLLFRSGPQRERANFFGHAHADLNSLAVSVAGANILVDGGTCAYRRGCHRDDAPGVDWREYFAGPDAHNGLVLSGLSPLGEFSGDFRPFDNSAFVQTTRHRLDDDVLALESTIHCDNAYDGCRRGVLHAAGRFTVVYDVLTPEARALSSRFLFQTARGVLVEEQDAALALRHNSGATLWLCASPGLELSSTLEGSLAPPGGWVSTAYGQLNAAPQLYFAPATGSGRCHAFLLAPTNLATAGITIETSTNGELSCHVRLGREQAELSLTVPAPQ